MSIKNAKPDVLRIWLTFCSALIGIGAILIAFLVAVEKFGHSNNPGELIPAVMGPLTAVVGTLVGYVAGHSAGSVGTEKAESRADQAEGRASGAEARMRALLDVAPKGMLDEAERLHSDAFRT